MPGVSLSFTKLNGVLVPLPIIEFADESVSAPVDPFRFVTPVFAKVVPVSERPVPAVYVDPKVGLATLTTFPVLSKPR